MKQKAEFVSKAHLVIYLSPDLKSTPESIQKELLSSYQHVDIFQADTFDQLSQQLLNMHHRMIFSQILNLTAFKKNKETEK